MASSNVTKLDPSSDTFKRILYNLQVRVWVPWSRFRADRRASLLHRA
jgi:hypothetical protein